MIICEKFPNDRHKWVMDIQHDCYDVGPIFEHARTHFLRAEAILEVTTETGERIFRITDLDHRILQSVHDLIAAHYRMVNDSKLDPQLLDPLSGEQVKNDWLSFYQGEIAKLCRKPEFVRNVCVAAVFVNPDNRGINAEEALQTLLQKSYGIGFKNTHHNEPTE